MTTITVDPDTFEIADFPASDVNAAIETISNGLKAQSLNVRTFTSDNCRHLKVTHLRSTVADLFIYPTGTVDWDYHSFTGTPHDLDRVTAVTLAILAEPESQEAATVVPTSPANFLDSIGRAAEAHGLSVTFASLEPYNAHPEIDEEVTITSPAQPRRGIVQITDDGALWWNCQLSNQPNNEDGLNAAEIATSITRALISSQKISPTPKRPATEQPQKSAA